MMNRTSLSIYRSAQRGVVLPVVLVLLVVLTSLVLMQIRRGTLDQQLSINSRQYTLVETSAQSVLRWCEARGLSSAGNSAIQGVDLTTPVPLRGASAAWKIVANWTGHAERFDAVGIGFPGVADFRCLYEESTRLELSPTTTNPPVNLEVGTIAVGGPPPVGPDFCPSSTANLTHYCKYRITVRVQPQGVASCDDTPRRCVFMQSELRFIY